MSPLEKRTFIDELVRRVRADIVAKIDKMPESWGELDLRQFVADQFARDARDWDEVAPAPKGANPWPDHQIGCATNKPGPYKGPCNCTAQDQDERARLAHVITTVEEIDSLIRVIESDRSNGRIDLSGKRREIIAIALRRLRSAPVTDVASRNVDQPSCWDKLKQLTGGKL